jgi:PAS domain S-box-containing protein
MESRRHPENAPLEAHDLDPFDPSPPFRLALEAAPTGMVLSDGEGRITFVNGRVGKLFGYTNGELMGMAVEELMPSRFRSRHTVFRVDYQAQPRIRTIGAGFELYGLRKDGTELPLEIGLTPLRTARGYFVLSSIVDISERRETIEQLRNRTAELSASVKERDVLLQEIHHRVKNNLQVISSLINMHIRKLGETAARDVLRECKARVETIGLIHEKLYQSRDYTRVPFSDYVRTLSANALQAGSASDAAITLRTDLEEISLAVDKAIPCGLILNELVTNAVKHAWPQGPRGTIAVGLKRVEGRVRLTVSDDGIGLPASDGRDRPNAIGLELVRTLIEQLDGVLTTSVRNGTTVQVEFATRP